jgi:phospholipid/cholesterol/gamma-HCH transport system substrate-binding protein
MSSAHRRLALAVLAAVLVAVAVVASPSSGDSSYRVDVVFDDSRGLVPGQLVQVAGARVGKIDEVTLTRDFKARVQMTVDQKFAPFRKDSTCTIRPMGLIAENYVECDPGSPDAKPIEGKGDQAPTVPVERTTQPVSLTDLFEIWDTPTRDRLHVLLSTLGIATAARGEDINAILRRANPTLALARDTIGMLENQRDDLTRIVDATDAVARELARRPEDLRALVRDAAKVTTRTASERAALGEGVRRLPGLLREATPALQKLDATMDAGKPLFDRATEAAPAVNRVTGDIPRLAAVAGPALKRLGPVLREGATTATRSRPLLELVRQYAASSLPTAKTAGVMFRTLEERGFTESFLELAYNGALAGARYDETSHILPSHIMLSECGQYATTPTPGCGSSLETPTREPAERRPRRRGRRERDTSREQRREPERQAGQAPSGPSQEGGSAPKLPQLPKLPELPDPPRAPLPEVPLPEVKVPDVKVPDVRVPGRDGGQQQSPPAQDLLDFLLG